MDGELPRKAHSAGKLDAVFECGHGTTIEEHVCSVDQGRVTLFLDAFGGSMHKGLGTCMEDLEVDQSVLDHLERGKRGAERLAFEEVIRDGRNGAAQRTDRVGTRQHLGSRRQPAQYASVDGRSMRFVQTKAMEDPCGVETPALRVEGDPLVSMDCGSDGPVFVRHHDDLRGQSRTEREDPRGPWGCGVAERQPSRAEARRGLAGKYCVEVAIDRRDGKGACRQGNFGPGAGAVGCARLFGDRARLERAPATSTQVFGREEAVPPEVSQFTSRGNVSEDVVSCLAHHREGLCVAHRGDPTTSILISTTVTQVANSRAESDQDVLTVSSEGSIRIVCMNRPEALNAANQDLHRRLAEVWAELDADQECRGVVLTGTGRAFSAGGDLGVLRQMHGDSTYREAILKEGRQIIEGMVRFPWPIVSAVNGPAVGLGCSLAGLSDVVLIEESAYLADPHVSVGLVAGDGGVLTWPLLTSLLRAKEYLLTGDRIPAAKAVEFGLANRVVPDGASKEEAIVLATRMATQPHAALKATKRALQHGVERAVLELLDFAVLAESVSSASSEHAEILDRMEKATGRGKG